MNPMAQLKDIHLPEEVGVWPLAYGWWLLAAIVIGVVILSIVLYKRYQLRQRAKKQALSALKQLAPMDPNTPAECNSILKRAVLSYFPADEVANLHGDKWLEYLSMQLPEKTRNSFAEPFTQLCDTLYRPASATDASAGIAAAQLWVSQALPPPNRKRGHNV